jgi:hypothetical protein
LRSLELHKLIDALGRELKGDSEAATRATTTSPGSSI